MAITLATPINLGDLGVFDKVRISRMNIMVNPPQCEVYVSYGKEQDGVWVLAPNFPGNRNTLFKIRNEEFSLIVANAVSSKAGELVYDLVAKYMYQWLVDPNGGEIAGIVDP